MPSWQRLRTLREGRSEILRQQRTRLAGHQSPISSIAESPSTAQCSDRQRVLPTQHNVARLVTKDIIPFQKFGLPVREPTTDHPFPWVIGYLYPLSTVMKLNTFNGMEALQSYLGLGIREDFATRNIWMHNPLKILDPHCLSFDPSRPAPHPFNHDAVFVCIDIEAFEFDANKITEIGIATLDTRELVGISSGPRAERWIDKITYRHLRVQEHLHLVNERFVKACPERFLFGESEIMDLPQIVTTLNHLFDQTSGIGGEPGAESEHQKRNLVFVGHSLKNDFAFLKTIGVSLDANVRATQDTERLAGGTKKKGVGLERLLKALDVDAQYLHNAGNDAAYTLQAMLRLAVLWAQGEMKTFQATLWSLPSSNSRKREEWEKLKRGATDQNALGAVREGSQLEEGARNKAVKEEAVEEGETGKTVVRRVAGSKALRNVLERQLREDAGKQLGETTKKRRWAGLGNESPERTGKPAMGGPRRRIGEEVREGFGGDLTAEIGARAKEERSRAFQARIQKGRQNMNSERK